MKRELLILRKVWEYVLGSGWGQDPVMKKAAAGAGEISASFGVKAPARARRHAALLQEALQRVESGKWPPTEDVRDFIVACIKSLALQAGAPPFREKDAAGLGNVVPPGNGEFAGGRDRFLSEGISTGPKSFGEAESPETEAAVARGRVPAADCFGDSCLPHSTGHPERAERLAQGLCAPDLNLEGEFTVVEDASAQGSVSTPFGENETSCACDRREHTRFQLIAAKKEVLQELALNFNSRAERILCDVVGSDGDPEVRALAAAYLGGVRTQAAEAALWDAAQDESAWVRGRAFGSLARFGGGTAERALAQASCDSSEWVRFEARLWKSRRCRYIPVRNCPFLTEIGLCEIPGAPTAPDCRWEVYNLGDHRQCPRWQAGIK